ncbi:SigE family RNA polymerase sigma factor [Tessaracoccus massiliensis]|uniref:SigE family RNA polymerase sigma factor n=1 Tax=Tessaracoccus massiliensis TaxID=1522311 RepID=UPI00058C2AB4|nr:SigE family RNA polymerase sigma factor [Tessaracoccus massiliensis]
MSEDVSEATLGFEGFVAQKGKRLWRAAWLLTGDSQHAEDLVQTALSKTYTRYGDIGNDAQFEAYVRTTIYRTFVSWWRKMSWRNEKAAEFVDDAPAPEAPHGVNLDLARALDELPRMQRAVLVLQYFEDLTTEQIAERLGVSSGAVKTHASRGRAALRSSKHPGRGE